MTWLAWLHSHLNYLHVQVNLHDVSQSALAAAVVVLGLVILLELRSVVQLRAVVDRNLARVFEQLDLLRFESQQLLEAQSQPSVAERPAAAQRAASPAAASRQPDSPPAVGVTPVTPGRYQNAATLAASGISVKEIADRCGLAAGEARLLASLVQARARRQGN